MKLVCWLLLLNVVLVTARVNAAPHEALLPVSFAVGGDPVALVAAHFTANGNLDLATVNQGSNDVTVLLGNANGTFHSAGNFAVGTLPKSIVTGDFNGDGQVDLAVYNYLSSTMTLLLGGPLPRFGARRAAKAAR